MLDDARSRLVEAGLERVADPEWPSWNGRQLSFLAQLNLAELRRHACCDLLPAEGLLPFSYDQQQETWGFDPDPGADARPQRRSGQTS